MAGAMRTLTRVAFELNMELIFKRRLLLERRTFILKSRMPQSEYTMNIFYIIGVVVVIIVVAGFLGLRV